MFFKTKFELNVSQRKKQIIKCYKLSYFHRIHLIAFSFLQVELLNVKRRRIFKNDAVPTISSYSQEVNKQRTSVQRSETATKKMVKHLINHHSQSNCYLIEIMPNEKPTVFFFFFKFSMKLFKRIDQNDNIRVTLN